MFFFYLHDSGFQRASKLHRGKTLWMLIAGFTDKIWMLQHPNRWNCLLLQKKKIVLQVVRWNAPTTSGSSAATFLVECTQAAARWHPKIPIKWYRSICIVSLERGSAVSFVQKKLPRIPLSFYRLGETRSQKEWSNLMDFSGYSDVPELQANLAR